MDHGYLRVWDMRDLRVSEGHLGTGLGRVILGSILVIFWSILDPF